jgi:hypothetical protein
MHTFNLHRASVLCSRIANAIANAICSVFILAMFAVCVAMVLTGCSQLQAVNSKVAQDIHDTIVAPVQQATLADAQAALAIANANGDTDAAACYADIVADLSAQSAQGGPVAIVGVLSALESARTFKGVQIPAKTHKDCAVLVVDAQKVAFQLGLSAASVVGGIKVQQAGNVLKAEAAALGAH